MCKDFFKDIPDFFNPPHLITIPSNRREDVLQTLQREFESIQMGNKKFYVKLRIALKDMPVMYVYFVASGNIAQSLEFWLFRNPIMQITAFRVDIFEYVEFLYSDSEDYYIDSWIFTFEKQA